VFQFTFSNRQTGRLNLGPLPALFSIKVIKNKAWREPDDISGASRSVQRSGRCRVGELSDGGRDPTPGIGAIVIAGGRELVNPQVALLERLIAVALEPQGGGAPDVDFRYQAPSLSLGGV
jgi:hypothetical protein